MHRSRWAKSVSVRGRGRTKAVRCEGDAEGPPLNLLFELIYSIIELMGGKRRNLSLNHRKIAMIILSLHGESFSKLKSATSYTTLDESFVKYSNMFWNG